MISKKMKKLNMKDVKHISRGANHVMILKNNGTLWGSGSNTQGQVGIGSGDYVDSLIKIASRVVQVSCGSHHTMFLKKNGVLFSLGSDSFGQGGNCYTDLPVMKSVVHVSAGYSHTAVLKDDGTLWTFGMNTAGQLGDGTTKDKCKPAKVLDNVAYVASCGYSTFVVMKDGKTKWFWKSF